MSTIKVSEMPTATSFEDDDYVMIVQSNTNKKITKQNMYGNYIYSTNETVIGKWVDDRPIYRKVFTGTSATPDGVRIDMTTIGASDIINSYGWVKSTYGQWWPISNHYQPDSNYDTSVNYTDNPDFNVSCGSYYSYPQYVIILEYIKTS